VRASISAALKAPQATPPPPPSDRDFIEQGLGVSAASKPSVNQPYTGA
jgi:hypothetical protein